MIWRRFLVFALLGLALVLRTAVAAPAERVFTVHGVVMAGLQDDMITVSHEAVPDYMPAMTMPFRVDPAARAQAAVLRAGDRVEFQFAVGEGSRAYDFRRVGAAEIRPVATAGPSPAPRRLKEGNAVPPFALVDQSGRAFTDADLRGRRTVLTFIFTRCPVPEFCPKMSTQFQTLQRRLKEAPLDGAQTVQLVSVSFDPAFDTPEVLRAYGERFGADPKLWRLCTGTEEQVRGLTQLFAVHVEKNGASLDHTLATALIGPDGHVLEIWRGNQWTPEEVVQALTEPADAAAR